MHQTPETKVIDRKDHVWRRCGSKYLCVLCGGMCAEPPDYPTPPGWSPLYFVSLNDEDRQLCLP